jgi:hypothetical protein
MQLTLVPPFNRFASRPSAGPSFAASTFSAREEAAISQLDQIAAQNLQASKQGLGGVAMFLGLIGSLVILAGASMWDTGKQEARTPVAAIESRRAPAAEAPAAPFAAPPVVAAEATPAVPAQPWPAQPLQTAEATPEPTAAAVAIVPAVAADDAARQARAKQQADARRKAALMAQERAAAEEAQRVLLAQQQQREAERAQQMADQARQRAAAEQARLAAAQSAADTRRGVGEICSGAGGFIGQQFCRSRECGKAEHRGDGVCVSLREKEAEQERLSAQR